MAFRRDVGVDLGTSTVLVYVKGEGIVLNEPSVVAFDKSSKRILAVGEEAKSMIGRTPGDIVAVRPMKEGVIADYEITEKMLKDFLKKALGRFSPFRPNVMVCIPSGATDVEKRAVLEAAMRVGAKRAFLIEEPMAAAIGAGVNISEARGSMVVDIGGGTTDIAVISLGGIVVSESLKVAGNNMDEAIFKYVKNKFNLIIGEQTAEIVKREIGSAIGDEDKEMDLRGRDLMTGLPKSIKITSKMVSEAISGAIKRIIDGVRMVLERTPAELSADVIDRGIVMTGGGSLLHGLDRLISEATGIATYVADDPLTCVVKGTGMALDVIDSLHGGILSYSQKR